MAVFVPKKQWDRGLRGWVITDCAVRSSTIIYLLARADLPHEKASSMWDHDILTRSIVIALDKGVNEKRLAFQELDGFKHPRCGVAREPLPQGLTVARNNDGDVCAVGGGRDPAMEHIAPGKVPLTQKVKCVDGYAYSVGLGRAVYKRANIGHWVKLDAGLPQEDATRYQGFSDLDGFSATDLYAVGGHGDVWHFDGTTWMQEGFPSNMQLDTVTCAGDGYVYVSGMGGTLWRGRNSTWEHLHDSHYTVPWNDALWFEDKLWLASDYLLRVWDGKDLVPVIDSDDQELPYSGHMDAHDGLLVVAGLSQVMAYQNGQWRTLVAPYE